MWKASYFPKTIEEALEILHHAAASARILAGGTDLILQLQTGEKKVRDLVDISRIESLQAIRLEREQIHIGGCATHENVNASNKIWQHAGVLAQAAGEVGSPQIRSLGTLGGNVVNAQPAADSALALIALDAEAKIKSWIGSEWRPMIALYKQPGMSLVDSTEEVLEEFRFPVLGPSSGSAYRRLGKCKSIALPVVTAAAVVHLDTKCEQFMGCRLAIGPVGPIPCLAEEVVEWITGQPVCDEVILEASRMARECAHPRSSLLRCSADYREQMVEVIVRSILSDAVENAKLRYLQLNTSGRARMDG